MGWDLDSLLVNSNILEGLSTCLLVDEWYPASSFGVLGKDEPVGSVTFEEGSDCVSEVDRVSGVS